MGKIRLLLLTLAVWGTIPGLPLPAAAEEAPRAATIEERLETLDQKVRILERQRELEQEESAAKAKKIALPDAGEKGFTLKSADGAYQLKVSGFVHSDGRFYFDDNRKPATNTFLIRRARLSFEGIVGKYVAVKIQPDFAGSKLTLYDAYFALKLRPEANLLAGKAKTPYGLERLQSSLDRRFVELGFPDALTPNRDIGFQLTGDALGGGVSYALAVLNGVVDGTSEDIDTNDEKDYAARIFAHPFKTTGIEPIEGLGIGVAATYGDQVGKTSSPNLPSFKTPGQQSFFTYLAGGGTDNTTIAAGERFRISPQAYYFWGPLGLLGEYARTRQEVSKGANGATLTNTAWQAAVWLTLTGEKESFRRITPKRPFDPAKGQWGAFEVVGRYGELRVDDDAFPTFAIITASPRRARSFAAGFNWYLNSNAKIVADYDQTEFTGGATAAQGVNREKEKVLLTRIQVSY